TSEESCFTFQILNGSKVSAKNIHFGSNDATRGQHAMGAFTFEMRGEEGNIAMLAGSGATNMNLARINDSSWSNNFLLKGYAKYQTAYGFNLGYNENCGGTGNFILSGENNVFQAGGNWNINGGQNAPDSDAAINISTENASNSSISVNGVNVFSGGNSQINVNIAGGTNTFSITNGDFNMYSSRYEGDSSAVFTISIPEFESTKNFRLTNRMSGGQRLVFANGVNAEINSANFTGSNISGGSANSYYVIEGGSTLTVVGDSGYNSQDNVLASGEVGFLIRGEGSSLIHKGQMNIAPGNHGNVGGVYAIRLHGANGVFEAQKNLHMSGLFEGADAMYLLEMLGSGNTANIHTLNLGNNNSTAGAYRVYSKSDSAENKNAIYLTSTEVHLQASVVEGSTARREFIMAGNTILRTSAGGGATIKILEFAGVDYLGGETLFEVRGSGNDALFNGLYLGNGVGTAGTGTFRIAGGGSKIACSYLRVMGGASTSFENPSGGILEYRLDDTGISALQVDGGFNGYLNGLLVVDFTGMQGGYENER
ncbi:MAG: hypothetical protein J6T16_03375, partial [Opitutales bacterium]|nr:hypothetical protein [Opitutales bacterium]